MVGGANWALGVHCCDWSHGTSNSEHVNASSLHWHAARRYEMHNFTLVTRNIFSQQVYSAFCVRWQRGTARIRPLHATLLCAVQQSIDIAWPQQQTCSDPVPNSRLCGQYAGYRLMIVLWCALGLPVGGAIQIPSYSYNHSANNRRKTAIMSRPAKCAVCPFVCVFHMSLDTLSTRAH